MQTFTYVSASSLYCEIVVSISKSWNDQIKGKYITQLLDSKMLMQLVSFITVWDTIPGTHSEPNPFVNHILCLPGPLKKSHTSISATTRETHCFWWEFLLCFNMAITKTLLINHWQNGFKECRYPYIFYNFFVKVICKIFAPLTARL